MLQPGLTFARHADILLGKRIGGGSFGDVFQATWRGQTVAVKRLHEDTLGDFMREASVLLGLHHPRIVLLMGFTDPRIPNQSACLIFEFVAGGSLHTALYKDRRAVDEKEIAVDMAEALIFLHTAEPPIIHRDLKSMNVLLDEEGKHAKLCDFGLARSKVTQNSMVQSFAGTPVWMAPEVLSNKPYGLKADVYSFAMILYELLTKSLPYHEFTDPLALWKYLAQPGHRPTLPPTSSSRWQTLIKLCWAQDPAARPNMATVLPMVRELPALVLVQPKRTSYANALNDTPESNAELPRRISSPPSALPSKPSAPSAPLSGSPQGPGLAIRKPALGAMPKGQLPKMMPSPKPPPAAPMAISPSKPVAIVLPPGASKPSGGAPELSPRGKGSAIVRKKAAPPPKKPAAGTSVQARALFSYNAQRHDELSFTEDEVISVLNKNSSGWWEGEVSGRRGLFPGNYVEEMAMPIGGASPVRRRAHTVSVVRALYSYTAQRHDELSFTEGDMIAIVSKNISGWWEGELNGCRGLFPANHVKELG